MDTAGIFDEVEEFPDPGAGRRFQSLVGIDDIKDRLVKEAEILINPELLENWSKTHHGQRLGALNYFSSRPPLFIFHGDVGTGKTALAETFGDQLSRTLKLPVFLYSLSLTTRGTGSVGEMTTLITTAFDQIRQSSKKSGNKNKVTSAAVMLIDEGDSLAQSRELSQMHHEDRAGVNAIIRGIDDLAEKNLPVVVVLCTNRLAAIDPAIKRRAAAIFCFERPNDSRREQIITEGLNGANLSPETIAQLVFLTGPKADVPYGFSYSDLTHRLLPTLILDAFPTRPLEDARVIEITKGIEPTPRFLDS